MNKTVKVVLWVSGIIAVGVTAYYAPEIAGFVEDRVKRLKEGKKKNDDGCIPVRIDTQILDKTLND